MTTIPEKSSFSTTEIQSIANSFDEDFGTQGSFPKEHPKACCCCSGCAAVVPPKTE